MTGPPPNVCNWIRRIARHCAALRTLRLAESTLPIARLPSVMCERQHDDMLVHHDEYDGEREPSHQQPLDAALA
jgi:hypothetical protein